MKRFKLPGASQWGFALLISISSFLWGCDNSAKQPTAENVIPQETKALQLSVSYDMSQTVEADLVGLGLDANASKNLKTVSTETQQISGLFYNDGAYQFTIEPTGASKTKYGKTDADLNVEKTVFTNEYVRMYNEEEQLIMEEAFELPGMPDSVRYELEQAFTTGLIADKQQTIRFLAQAKQEGANLKDLGNGIYQITEIMPLQRTAKWSADPVVSTTIDTNKGEIIAQETFLNGIITNKSTFKYQKVGKSKFMKEMQEEYWQPLEEGKVTYSRKTTRFNNVQLKTQN